MLPRELRLNEKRLYDQVFRRGTWARGRYFSVVWLATNKPGKLGFIVTKKVTKSAVARNRSKRRIRALMHELLQGDFSPLMQYHYLVVVLHQTVDNVSPGELKNQVERVLHKIPMEQA